MTAVKPHHLKIFLSNRYAYAQIVRVADGHIVAAASTIEKGLKEGLQSAADKMACSRCVLEQEEVWNASPSPARPS